MVAKMELASAYVTINASTAGMAKQLGKVFGQAESQASTTGQRMGKSIQKGLNAASTSSVEDLQKRLTSGEEKLAAASERASRRRSAAARGVEIAEAKLNEVKDKGNAKNSQILAAEDRVIKARERYTQVSRNAVAEVSGYAKEVQYSKDALNELADSSTRSGGAVRAAFSGVSRSIGAAFTGATSVASSAMSGIRTATSVAASAVKSSFAGVGSFLKNIFTGNFSGAFDQIVSGAKTAGSAVSTAFSNVWGGFRNGVANARSSIADAAGNMVSSFGNVAARTGSTISAGLSRGFTAVKTVASRSAAENFSAFTSGAGRAASGIGNALSGGFRSTVGAARTAATNGASALTRGFAKAGSAISTTVSRGFSGIASIAGRVGNQAGQSMTNGIMAHMKGLPAMIGGLVGIGGAGAVLASGFNRLMDLQKSDIVFKNLGLSSKETSGLMDKLNDAVTGTSVSLSDASKNASLLMQSGVKLGPELDASTKALTNLAAASGSSASDIGTIMTQIKASGQLYAGDALQLMQRGVPVYSYLAKSMGKTTDEVKKMGTEGKISYEDFVKAVNENTGDLAKEMGQTLPAKIGIMKTAFASFGAELIKPFVGPLTQAVDAVTGVLKNTITPAIKNFFGWLDSGSKSAEIFKGVAIVLAIAITAVAVAFGAMALGIMAVNFAVGIFDALTGGILIWIGAAIAAVVGLVAGFVVMYKKVGWFHDGVNAAWGGIKKVISIFVGWWTGTAWPAIQRGLDIIGKGFVWLWQNIIVPAWGGIVAVAQWAWNSILKPIFKALAWIVTDFLAPVFVWLWQDIIVPAWNAIVEVAKWAWDNVLKPIFTDISNFVRDVVGPVFGWLWENAIKPAWDAISTAISWAWENVIKPVFGFILTILKNVVGPVFQWLLDYVIVPVFKGIGFVILAAWLIIKGIFYAIGWVISNILAPVFTWLWQNVIVPAWNGISAAVQWAWNTIIKPAFDAIWGFITNTLAPIFVWLWQNVIVPAWDAISQAVSWAWNSVIKPAFDAIWGFITNILAPVFVWLWQNIIVPVWDGIKFAVVLAIAIIMTLFDGVVWLIQNVLGPIFVWLWQNVIVPAWNGIAAVISWAWNNIIKPAWDAINWVINNILVPVFKWLWDVLVLVWNGIVAVISWAWNYVIKPIWDGINWFINAILVPVFKWLWGVLVAVWNGIAAVISWAWNNVIRPIWDGINWFINNILVPVFNWLRDVISNVWNGIVNVIRWAWNNVIKPIWDGIKWFIDNILIPAFNWLRDAVKNAWDSIGSIISKTWNWIRDTVLNPMGDFLQKNVVDFFRKTKDGIENIWNKVKDVAKAPIGFVIDTILRDGIIGNFNKIAPHFGVGEIAKNFHGTKDIKGWATGGYTGPGRKYDEAGVVHKDEFVIRKESTNKVRQEYGLGSLNYLNATGDLEGAFRMSKSGVDPRSKKRGNEHGLPAGPGSPTYAGLPSFGNQLQRDVARKGEMAVTGRVAGNWKLGSSARAWNGMSGVKVYGGAKAGVPTVDAREVSGPWWAGFYDTSGIQLNSGQQWADANKFRPLVAIHEIGHALGLPHSMGTGGGKSIMDYDTMYSLKGPSDKDAKALQSIYPGGDGKGRDADGGGINPLAWLLDDLKGKFKKAFPQAAAFVDLGWGMGEKLIKGAIAKFDIFSDDGEGGPAPEGSVKEWMTKALKMKGMFSETNLNNGVRRAMQESGGNPRAINNWDINAMQGNPSKGLMQVIPTTFAANKEPGHGDIWNPIDNILASINYTMRRYGSLGAGWNRAGGYADGGLVTPSLFDNGGKLQRGVQFIDHQRRDPDYVLTEKQWNAMYSIADSNSNGTQVHVTVPEREGLDPSQFGRRVGEATAWNLDKAMM